MTFSTLITITRWPTLGVLVVLLSFPAFGQPYLILHDIYYVASRDGASGTIPTPAFIRDNKEYLETTPFDGTTIYLRTSSNTINATRYIFTNRPVGYASIYNILSPLKGLHLNSLKHNFAFITIDRPADWFDDWSIAVRNFSNLARAAKEIGLRGIFLDNEQYYGKLFNYPDAVSYPERTLDEYRNQARLRGREIMQAMVAEFPQIEILLFHGPYVSSPNAPFWTPEPDRHPLFQRLDAYYELLGPFFVGLVEGAGEQGAVIDGGGSLKHFRTEIDFELGYQFRKHDIASEVINSAFIPPPLRIEWPQKVHVANHLYDKPIRGQDMNPVIARDTLVHALRYSDKYAWVYSEENKFLLPPSDTRGAPIEWLDAIRSAKQEVLQALSASTTPSCSVDAKQAFTFTFKTGTGSPVTSASILVSEGFRKVDSCWISYDPSSNLIFLASDDLTSWSSAPFGATGNIRNSQCLVLLGGSSAIKGTDELTLKFSLWFLDDGPKEVYLRTNGVGYDSGYVLTGTWNVP